MRRITVAAIAVGQVGDDLGRRRVERREVELERVGDVQRDVVEWAASTSLSCGSSAAVDLDDVHVRDARAARRSDSTPRPPPISSTTSSAPSSASALDHVEDVAVDEEVLTELR